MSSASSSPLAPARPERPRRRRVRRVVVGLLVVGLIVGLAIEIAAGRLSWRGVVDAIAGWNAAAVFAAIALLPVAGFSVAITYVVAGAKFGPWLGGAAVAAATAVHLLASYAIGRSLLRGPIERWLARRRHHLPHVPPGENAAVAAMAALVPGLPYAARNYLLALTDVPLRTYFWVCWPIYVVRSGVAILLGDLGAKPDGRTIALLAGVYAVKLAICVYLLWRIRRRLRRRSALIGRAGKASDSLNDAGRPVSHET
jgi:uncharacterized membrane protein YdjX (TVP38/TMEM64 family)